MCKVLNIPRSLVYYKRKNKRQDIRLESEIIRIFKESKNNYGTRKIKVELSKLGYQVSRRRIGIIMKLHGLVSNYTVKQFKVHKAKCNEEKVENIVDRKFDRDGVCQEKCVSNQNIIYKIIKELNYNIYGICLETWDGHLTHF